MWHEVQRDFATGQEGSTAVRGLAGSSGAICMATQTGKIVRSGIVFQRPVWIVAGEAGQALIAVRAPAAALLQPVCRKAHRDLAHHAHQRNVFRRPMTGSAEIDGFGGRKIGWADDVCLD